MNSALQEVTKSALGENLNPKKWADVLKSNSEGDFNGSLEYTYAGDTVVFSEEEWEEGRSLWKHAIEGAVQSFKPSYSYMLQWVGMNWKSYHPKVYHVKPGVYLFEFNSEEDKLAILGRNWSFYHKSAISLQA